MNMVTITVMLAAKRKFYTPSNLLSYTHDTTPAEGASR